MSFFDSWIAFYCDIDLKEYDKNMSLSGVGDMIYKSLYLSKHMAYTYTKPSDYYDQNKSCSAEMFMMMHGFSKSTSWFSTRLIKYRRNMEIIFS